MKYTDFNMNEHGFVGHMAEPEAKTKQAVIVIMGGEKSILPGIKIAERFAEYGICGLAVSLFAALVAKYIDRIDNVIMVSPSHVPFEGSADKKNMTGHSMMTWRGKEIPFVKLDFAAQKAGKYFYDERAGRKVTGMWISYRDAYQNKEAE